MQLLYPVTASHLQDNSYNLSLMLIITIMIIDNHGKDNLSLSSPGSLFVSPPSIRGGMDTSGLHRYPQPRTIFRCERAQGTPRVPCDQLRLQARGRRGPPAYVLLRRRRHPRPFSQVDVPQAKGCWSETVIDETWVAGVVYVVSFSTSVLL